jgi:hypothetical protein
MKGGVDEQVHVIQDEGAIDVDVDAASVALELPGMKAAGGRQADVDNVQNLSHFQVAASSRMKELPMIEEKPMGQVIQIDEARIRDHLGEMVRGTVEETLNAMLDAEADQFA